MDKRQHKSVIVLDENMNVTQDYVLKEGEEVKIEKKNKTLTPKQKHFINRQNNFKKHCDNLGGYIHMIYCKNELLFNSINIDKANISRIIYLATYVDYDNRKEGLLCVRVKDNKLEPMNRKTMQVLLKLGDTAFKKFLSDVKNNNLMYEVDKKFYVNTEYFNKGEIINIDENKSYCRLFINPIRNLYEGCKPTKHKVLSSVYQLVPYIHIRSNALCLNPYEYNEEPEKMDSNTLCDLLNVGSDKGQRSRFIKELYTFTVTVNKKEYQLFSYVKVVSEKIDFYFVNPYVLYGGSDEKYMKQVAKDYFFKKL